MKLKWDTDHLVEHIWAVPEDNGTYTLTSEPTAQLPRFGATINPVQGDEGLELTMRQVID